MESLWTRGYHRLGTVLKQPECEALRTLYAQPELFRSRIDMARYRFGRGEYQYFAYPLPEIVDELRRSLYQRLAPVAREWMAALSLSADYPDNLDQFLEICHANHQPRPTPLL